MPALGSLNFVLSDGMAGQFAGQAARIDGSSARHGGDG